MPRAGLQREIYSVELGGGGFLPRRSRNICWMWLHCAAAALEAAVLALILSCSWTQTHKTSRLSEAEANPVPVCLPISGQKVPALPAEEWERLSLSGPDHGL